MINSLPQHTLILHCPWLKANGYPNDYVGPIDTTTWSDLVKCIKWNELGGITPEILDCYLRISNKQYIFSNNVVNNDIKHVHVVDHFGKKINVKPTGEHTSLDDDDSGDSFFVSSTNHTHKVNYDSYRKGRKMFTGVYNEGEEEPYECKQLDPYNFEVNAYYANNDLTTIPAGTIAFFNEEVTNDVENDLLNAGWLVLNKKEMPIDKKYGVGTKWDDCYLKVVECTPSLHGEGNKTHDHNFPNHTHKILSVANNETGQVIVDESGANEDLPSAVPHNHAFDNANSSIIKSGVSSELNDPRSINIYFIIAIKDGPDLVDGMIFPFIPKDIIEYGNLPTHFLHWQPNPLDEKFYLHALKINDPDYPCDKEDTACDDVGTIHPIDKYHIHETNHTHKFVFKKGGGGVKETKFKDQSIDDHVSAASKMHSHELEVSESFNSGKTENKLRHRRIAFIRFENP